MVVLSCSMVIITKTVLPASTSDKLALISTTSRTTTTTTTKMLQRSHGKVVLGGVPRRHIRCIINATDDLIPVRRSGNYQPPIWSDDCIQSLNTNTDYVGERFRRRLDELKEQVKRILLEQVVEPLDKLELIDNLQRLGVSYHFKEETKRLLESIYNSTHHNYCGPADDHLDLHAASLKFRLLRQHGFNVSQEIFDCFKDEEGNFKSSISEDTKGMLSLYEAAYFSIEGESSLDMAKEFTTRHLKEKLMQNMDPHLAINIQHALELPLHWRMQRLEARWFIDIYKERPNMNSILLEFAKLDFYIVQAIHQSDLRYASEWWKNTGFVEKLSFARDSLMVDFFWTVGLNYHPQYGYYRRMSTKLVAFITTIDDIYDVYGTLDELQLFTQAVERWDINQVEQLPDYMKICYFSLFNSINEMAYDVLKEQGCHIISLLKRIWLVQCKCSLQEAQWYLRGYTPTLEEYLNNALTTVGIPLLLVHGYILATNPIRMEALKCLEEDHNIVRWTSIIVRLANDLATSTDELKRGDVPKSIQCYMRESGASEEDAREHIKWLIGETWKKLNKYLMATEYSPFSDTFVELAMNMARTSHCVYCYGDGHGMGTVETNTHMSLLLIEPIPLV